jgi:hypothetical protein
MFSHRLRPLEMQVMQATTRPKKAITIMADFGNGPYAWLKDASDERSYVGCNIADAVFGFRGQLPVSAGLEHDFAEWVTAFERSYDQPTFNWPGFHLRGLALAQRLYDELNGTLRVVYAKPSEDPSYPAEARTEIRSPS